MGKTFILVTQEAEKLGTKHLLVFFETPCISNEAIHIYTATITANIGITDITVITTIMKSNITIIYKKAINLDIKVSQQLLKGLATIVITVSTDVPGPTLQG